MVWDGILNREQCRYWLSWVQYWFLFMANPLVLEYPLCIGQILGPTDWPTTFVFFELWPSHFQRTFNNLAHPRGSDRKPSAPSHRKTGCWRGSTACRNFRLSMTNGASPQRGDWVMSRTQEKGIHPSCNGKGALFKAVFEASPAPKGSPDMESSQNLQPRNSHDLSCVPWKSPYRLKEKCLPS